MENTPRYTFKMNRAVPLWKKVLGALAGLALLAIPVYYVITNIEEMAFWWPAVILIVSVILVIVVYLLIVTDRNPLKETIQFHEEFFDSKHFGKVYYADILYIQSGGVAVKITQFDIRLIKGRTLKWEVKGLKIDEKDQQLFYDFIQTVSQNHKSYLRKNGKTYPRDYKVNHAKPSGILYGLLCFLFIPVLLIPNINSWGFWVFPMIFIPLVGGIILLIKKTARKDHVILFKTHLQSNQKERIAYDEIDTIITAGSKMNPELTLILKDGEKIKWRTLNFGTTDRNTTIHSNSELWHFMQDLAHILDKNTATVDPIPVRKPEKATFEEAAKKPVSTKSASIATANSTSSSSEKELKNDIPSAPKRKEIKHIRGKKAAYIGIPVSLVVAVFLLVRTCDFQDHPLQDAEKNSQQSRQKALQLVQGFTKKNGPYLLFTNDTAAKLYTIPEKKITTKTLLEEMQKRTQQDYVPQKLRNINAGFKFYKQMRYAQRYPDSVNWHLTLIRKKTAINLGENLLRRQDNVAPKLYIATYTPKVKRHDIPSMRAYRRKKGLPDSTERKLRFALPIHPNLTLKENVEKLRYNQLENLLKTFLEYPETTQLYVVGKVDTQAMTRTQFKQLIDQLRAILTEHHIGPANFQIKRVP